MSFTSDSEQALRLIHGDKNSGLDLDIQAFMLDCQVRNLSPNTLRIYKNQLRAFQAWVGNTPTQDVTTNILRRYLLVLRETHNPGGVHQAYRVLKTFFRWLRAEGEMEHNPMERIQAPKVREELLEPVPIETVKAMLATCESKSLLDTRDAAVLLFLLDTGARASETLAVNGGDLDVSAGAVMLRETKNGKPRAVFLGVGARKALLRYIKARGGIEPTAPLWVTIHGGRLTYSGMRQILRRRAEQANVPAPSAHDFRRAFCLASLRSGMDVFTLKNLAGHADLSTTRRYLKQVASDLQEAHAQHSPVDRLL